MRMYGTHYVPRTHQAMPADNTSTFVYQQVRVWVDTGVLIHPEMAWEIAAWYSTPGRGPGQAFTHLEATGRMLFDELMHAIDLEKAKLALDPDIKDEERQQSFLCLGALRTFIMTVRREQAARQGK